MSRRHSGAVSTAGCVNVRLPTVQSALSWLSWSKTSWELLSGFLSFARFPLSTLNATSVPAHCCCHICFSRLWLKVYLKQEVNVAQFTPTHSPLQDKQTKRLMISAPMLLPPPEHDAPKVPPGKTCFCVSQCNSPCSPSHWWLSACKVKMELFTGTCLLLPQLIFWVHVFESGSAHHPPPTPLCPALEGLLHKWSRLI